MMRAPILTDSLIRDALVPGPGVMPPHGLLASIGDEIRVTPQARTLVLLPGLGGLTAPAWLPRDRRLAMLIAAVALLLVLLGGALIGSGLDRSGPTPLRPTGLVSITPEAALVDRVVVDGRGGTWAIALGQLTRFDPATGERKTWTAADDAAFSMPLVAPAREGGVWVLADGRMRRFDGEGFLDTIPVDADSPMELVIAPDGTPWLASYDLGLQRWDGSRWVSPPPGRPTDRVEGPLLALGADDIWVENPGPGRRGEAGPTTLGVSHLVDGAWVNYDTADALQLIGPIEAIEQAADGSVWITRDAVESVIDPRIARFDGSSWTAIDGPPVPARWLQAGDDGSMWAITAAPDGSAGVARWEHGTWRVFGPEDGVPGVQLGQVSVTPSGVFLGTTQRLLRYAEGRWEAAWPFEPARDAPAWVVAGAQRLVAVSRDEAWTADEAGLWHWLDGAWQGPILPPGLDGADVFDLASGPDGSLWVATDFGVARLAAGAWTILSDLAASRLAVGADGTGWAVTSGRFVEQIVPVAGGADVRTMACPLSPFVIGAASDGTAYLGAISYSSGVAGLARADGSGCEMIEIPGMAPPPEITSVLADPRGGVVVEALETLPEYPGGGPWHGHVMRVDGAAVTRLTDEGVGEAWMRLRLVDPTGRVWRASSGTGVEAWDGKAWTTVLPDVDIVGPLSVAPDGTVFFVGPGAVFRWIPDAAAGQAP